MYRTIGFIHKNSPQDNNMTFLTRFLMFTVLGLCLSVSGVQAQKAVHEQYDLDTLNWVTLKDLSKAVFDNRQVKANKPLLEQTIAQAEREFGKQDTAYALALKNLAVYYAMYDLNAERAEALFIEAAEIYEPLTGKNSWQLFSVRFNWALLYYDINEWESAIKIYETLINELDSQYHSNQYFIMCKEKLTDLYSLTNRQKEAERSVRALLLLENHYDRKGIVDLKIKLAEILVSQNRLDTAQVIFESILADPKNKQPKMMISLLNSKRQLADLYTSQGNYVNAERLYLEAKDQLEASFAQNSEYYINVVNSIAIFYRNVGLEIKMITYYKMLHELAKKRIAANGLTPNYSILLSNIAAVYAEDDDLYTESEQIFEEVIAYQKQVFGDTHPVYLRTLNNLATVYMDRNKKQQAIDLLKQIMAANEKSEMLEYKVRSLHNLAAAFKRLKNYDSAEVYFQKAYALSQAHLSSFSSVHRQIEYALGSTYFIQNRLEEAAPYFKNVWEIMRKEMELLLPILSENERIEYVEKKIGNLNALNAFYAVSYSQDPTVAARMLEQSMFTKGLVFYSTQKMREQILDSGNPALIQAFESWKARKKEYAQAIGNSEKEEVLKAMQAQIERSEKEISKKSEFFARQTQKENYQWQDLQKQLKENEVLIDVIELINVNSKDTIFTNQYGFVFLTASQTMPELILLNDRDLDNKNLKYYQNAIIYKIEDQNSYAQYWQPIAEKIAATKGNFDKIYFSPAGVYHQISLNALQNPDNDRFLIQDFDIEILGNPADLIRNRKKKQINLQAKLQDKSQEVYLFGYPIFRLESSEAGEENTRKLSRLQSIASGGAAVALLPGTLSEIENIEQLFKAINKPVRTFIGADVREDTIKKMQSPLILHIATHGFFIGQDNLSYDAQDLVSIEEAKLLSNPLLNSGLLFAGCENSNPDGEDGVLTSAEALGLNLENTDLVVLSACETGLGDIRYGEGVFGLQRAFKQAGARTMLMSLWKVSDEATQILMTSFYKNLLAGEDKRTAFKNAQLSLKAQFPEPYYWGAFVMIE
ncbi:MAG: CHAT domain-containing protein [Bernardetiaceae bacterium]|nr:CHAT domain-containing protein [Bernardetiaceae bacterium]